ncbi:unnamed protein product [Musa acuminata subsp. malaccensis]|uniref:(wild Malaysian banana) hypothetical protein n=1 Tax=Musa acuminata subsp. malaccensis TaxID=214687 RepID=A0A804J791_MUSAM|nr:unnamed protein product [Musa acuminata subsp. malaccensis]
MPHDTPLTQRLELGNAWQKDHWICCWCGQGSKADCISSTLPSSSTSRDLRVIQ